MLISLFLSKYLVATIYNTTFTVDDIILQYNAQVVDFIDIIKNQSKDIIKQLRSKKKTAIPVILIEAGLAGLIDLVLFILYYNRTIWYQIKFHQI